MKNFLRNFVKDKKGVVDPLIIVIIGVIMITIIITVVIFYNISESITLTSTRGQSQLNNTTDSAVSVFNLMNVVGIVAVAGLIIAILIGFFATKR
jgi:hypothetical protein